MQTAYTFGPVALSSLERVAFYLNKDIGRGRVNGVNNDTDIQRRTRRSLLGWLLEVSSGFQNYCQREFLVAERVQYFDVAGPKMEYFPTAVPVLSISEVANDPLGLFNGGEWILTPDQDYHLSQTARSIVMVFNVLIYGNRSLRITCTGGLAYDAVNSTYTVEDEEGSSNIQPGYYAFGATSEAIGKVVSYNAGSHQLVLASVSGVFGLEDLTFQPAIYSQDIANTGATISAISRQSLVEAYPDLAQAINTEVRYMEKHEFDFENHQDAGKNGATRRPILKDGDIQLTFQPETLRVLDFHRRYLVGS